ncbi:MAG: patatin-like protein [Actinomycetota bacterium]
MRVWDSVGPDDYQELRVAVVMNGGVSLAIWIGGVGRELNRLTEARPADGTCYAQLLELIKSRARIDVLAGTSAGGINAGFLALAAVYGADLKSVGRLWADAGSLMELMRGPLDSDTPSLLKGDSYFLPKLQEAFAEVIRGKSQVRDTAHTPIDLTITTSLMDGWVRNFVDDFGTNLQQAEHRGRFHFVRGAQAGHDPFAAAEIVDHLALAARSTASFPLAFEASFVPVAPGEAPADRDSFPDHLVNFDRSRFVLDGGVLMNMPMEPALRAIFNQPAGNEVRRVLTYINPDPAALSEAEAARFRDPPPVTEVLGAALIKLPAAQAISRELQDLEQNNAQARIRKALRPELLQAVGKNHAELAKALFPIYIKTRILHAARNIAAEVLAGRRPSGDAPASGPDTGSGRSRGIPEWTKDEIAGVFRLEKPSEGRTANGVSPAEIPLPFVPSSHEALDFSSRPRWEWGLAPVERLGVVALDILKRALYVAPFMGTDTTASNMSPSQLRRNLREGRELIHGYLVDIRAMRSEDIAFWRGRAQLPDPPSADPVERRSVLKDWAAGAVRELEAYLEHPGDGRTYTYSRLETTVRGIVEVLLDRTPELEQAARQSQRLDNPLVSKEAADLQGMTESLLGTGPNSPTLSWEQVVSRMLSVEVGYMAMTSGGGPQDQDVELMQISANLQHGFGGPGAAAKKLAGVQMAHFGAFYKKSWRVNDWIWGRMDGALRLVEAALAPPRLMQLALRLEPPAGRDTGSAEPLKPHQTGIMPLLRELAVGDNDSDGYLGREFDKAEEGIRTELRFLNDAAFPVPASLPFTAGVIARRIYLEIIQEELGELASAVEVDLSNGADRASNGAAFAKTFDREAGGSPGLTPQKQLDLFANAGIGQETILQEKGTDLFAATASRTAAVMTAVANAPKIPAVRTILRPVRGLTLLLYSLVYGSVVGSRFGAWAVNAVLATGGALLAVALLNDSVHGLVKVVASAIVIAGLALAALRSGMLALTVILGLPIAGLAGYALYRGEMGHYWAVLVENQLQILTVAGLVIALGALGFVRNPRWLQRSAARLRRRP